MAMGKRWLLEVSVTLAVLFVQSIFEQMRFVVIVILEFFVEYLVQVARMGVYMMQIPYPSCSPSPVLVPCSADADGNFISGSVVNHHFQLFLLIWELVYGLHFIRKIDSH